MLDKVTKLSHRIAKVEIYVQKNQSFYHSSNSQTTKQINIFRRNCYSKKIESTVPKTFARIGGLLVSLVSTDENQLIIYEILVISSKNSCSLISFLLKRRTLKIIIENGDSIFR